MLLTGQVELVCTLKIHPKISRHAKVLTEAQGGVRGQVPLACEDLVQPVRRNLDDVRELLCCEVEILQLVGEDFSGVDWCASQSNFLSLLVVIRNFNIRRAGRIFRPFKTRAPPVIDPDRILPLAVSRKGFEPVRFERGKIG